MGVGMHKRKKICIYFNLKIHFHKNDTRNGLSSVRYNLGRKLKLKIAKIMRLSLQE